MEGSQTSNIIVEYSFDINVMPREFGVCPATIHLLRPAAFSKNAKKFAKICQKIGPGAYFPRQNVARYWCNTKKNNTKCFYMLQHCPTIRVTYQNAFRPLQSSGAFHSGIYTPSKNRNFISILFFHILSF